MSNEDIKGIKLPPIALEEYEVPDQILESSIGIKNTYAGSLEFGVIGSGQAGGRIAHSFYKIGYRKVVAFNTADADLNPLDIPAVQKVKIGDHQGSGKSMARGERAASDAQQLIYDKIRDVFGIVDKIIICAGLGGGSGAGSLGVLVSIVTRYLSDIGIENPAMSVIVIAALPTAGELKSYDIAKNVEIINTSVASLIADNKVGPVFLMDNAKIEQLYKGIPPAKFWGTVNDTITGLFQIFNYLSKQESAYTSFDAEDYKKVLTTSGIAVMGVTKIRSTEPLSQALQDNFKKTLLARDVDYTSAKEAATIVVADDATMSKGSMDVINYGFDAVHNMIGNANLHRGLYNASKDGIRAYTLIAGMLPVKNTKLSAYA